MEYTVLLRKIMGILVAVLLLPFLPATSIVYAQSTYTIPIEKASWSQHTIIVQVASSPKWAHDDVIQAMEIWNQAQEWFQKTYYPNGHLLLFTTNPGGSFQIPVSFVTSPIGGEYGGLTSYSYFSDGSFDHVNIKIDIQWGEAFTDFVALHELGHALGLGHATYSEDVMTPSSVGGVTAPSTLDLYAVHVLAQGALPSSVTLPSNIPYMTVPETALPELQNYATSTVTSQPQYTPYTYATYPTISSVFTGFSIQPTSSSPLVTLNDPTTQLALILAATIMIAVVSLLVYSRRGNPTKSVETKTVEALAKKAVLNKAFCIECGSELPLGSKFCNNCGTKQP